MEKPPYRTKLVAHFPRTYFQYTLGILEKTLSETFLVFWQKNEKNILDKIFGTFIKKGLVDCITPNEFDTKLEDFYFVCVF